MSVVIETSLGNFTVDLFIKHRTKCSYNFLKLCKLKYYNYNLIFEVKKDYAFRSGDPTNTGNGGHSIYYFDDDNESKTKKKYFSAQATPIIKHSSKGLISMINNGRDQHGSQFLITTADNVNFLDKQNHTVFGQVVEGIDIVELINSQIVDKEYRPYRDICISHTVILDDPFEDLPFISKRYVRLKSPDIPDYIIDSSRVGICEDLDPNEGKSDEQIKRENEEKEAKSRAIVLEMLGDLPNADVKPPENILFICKLNPMTEEDDLQRIFSRFGKINSVQIIKDPKTSQSLQYGFIEFDNKEDCEKAYFKMDNVLIDDRRVHVDFSQSVSRVRRNKR